MVNIEKGSVRRLKTFEEGMNLRKDEEGSDKVVDNERMFRTIQVGMKKKGKQRVVNDQGNADLMGKNKIICHDKTCIYILTERF